MVSRTRLIIATTGLVVIGVLGIAGVASAKDDSSDQPSGHRYEHHRDSNGGDHYGKLYTKPMKEDNKEQHEYTKYEKYDGNPLTPFLPTSTDYN